MSPGIRSLGKTAPRRGLEAKNELPFLLRSALGCRWVRRSKDRVGKGNLRSLLGSPAPERDPQVARRASCWCPVLLPPLS